MANNTISLYDIPTTPFIGVNAKLLSVDNVSRITQLVSVNDLMNYTNEIAVYVANKANTTANIAYDYVTYMMNAYQPIYDTYDEAILYSIRSYDLSNTALENSVIAFDNSNSAILTANDASLYAYSVYSIANSANFNSIGAYDTANLAFNSISYAYDQSNTAYIASTLVSDTANNALAAASQAYDQSNTAYNTATAISDTANNALAAASQAYDQSNTAYNTATAISDTANNASDVANSALQISQEAFNSSNTVLIVAQSAFAKANSTLEFSQMVFDSANTNAANASYLSTGIVKTSVLGTGTANSDTFLSGDNTWKMPQINTASFLTPSSIGITVQPYSANTPNTILSLSEVVSGNTYSAKAISANLLYQSISFLSFPLCKRVKVYTTSSTFTPEITGQYTIHLVGAGGSGGALYRSTYPQNATGGGAGGYGVSQITLQAGTTYTITIGSGGAGVTSSINGTGVNGNPGGNTSFSGTGIPTLIAYGGGGGKYSTSSGGSSGAYGGGTANVTFSVTGGGSGTASGNYGACSGGGAVGILGTGYSSGTAAANHSSSDFAASGGAGTGGSSGNCSSTTSWGVSGGGGSGTGSSDSVNNGFGSGGSAIDQWYYQPIFQLSGEGSRGEYNSISASTAAYVGAGTGGGLTSGTSGKFAGTGGSVAGGGGSGAAGLGGGSGGTCYTLSCSSGKGGDGLIVIAW